MIVGTAVAILTFYLAYGKFTSPPRSLSHIPNARMISSIRALINGLSASEIAKKINIPVASKSEHGIYVRFDNLGWTVRVARPEAAKQVIMRHDIFPKSKLRKERKGTIAGRLLIGPNIVFSTGNQWLEHRKIVNPAFRRALPVELFGRLTTKMLQAMDDSGRLNAHDIVQRWTLDVIGQSAFGFDFNALGDRNNAWVNRYHYLITNAQNIAFFLLPILEQKFLFLFPARQEAHREMSIFLGMMTGIIEERKKQAVVAKGADSIKDTEKDLLTLMIEAENNGEGKLSSDELLSNLCVFFLAGHDTTASALASTIYYLAVNQEIQDKARKETMYILGDAPEDIQPTLEQTRQLEYINWVIKETLRITPPAPATVPRIATQDTELCGVFIPKGTKVGLDIYELHHNPTVWKDPETFNPNRFAPGGEADELSKLGLAWLPFSSGTRQCIGMNFSLVQQRVLLMMLLRKFKWTLPEDSIHKDGLVTYGIGATLPKDLYINFIKLY